MKNIRTTAALILSAILLASCGSQQKITVNDEGIQVIEAVKRKSDEWKQYKITEVGEFRNGVARIKVSGDKYGYIDINGNIVVEPVFEKADEYMNGAAKVQKKYVKSQTTYTTSYDYHSYIYNASGTLLASSQADNVAEIGEVSQGMYYVKTVEELISGNVYKNTYYDTQGNEKFSFENVIDLNTATWMDENFSDLGYALINIDGVSSIVDTNGNILEFDFSEFYDGKYPDYISLTSVYENMQAHICPPNSTWGYTGYVDIENRKVYSDEPEVSFNLSTTGKFISAASDISDFQGARSMQFFPSDDGEYATVLITSKDNVVFYSIIDISGNVLMKPTKAFGSVSSVSEGTAAAQDASSGLWGYIDTAGNWIIQPSYSSAGRFSEGHATVENNIVINLEEKVIFDFNSIEK